MKRVRFIPHAEQRLSKRRIERQWAIETILLPEQVEPTLFDLIANVRSGVCRNAAIGGS